MKKIIFIKEKLCPINHISFIIFSIYFSIRLFYLQWMHEGIKIKIDIIFEYILKPSWIIIYNQVNIFVNTYITGETQQLDKKYYTYS